jgi:hypothetical protein
LFRALTKPIKLSEFTEALNATLTLTGNGSDKRPIRRCNSDDKLI